MTSADDGRALDLFLEASELPDGERGRFLDRACGPDGPLRRRVEELLGADQRHPDGRHLLDSAALLRVQADELEEELVVLPERIGPYRVLGRLGVGGTGIVFEAEQETPRRRVALKVLWPLVQSPERERRFRREAEVLGRLQHEGIARILEAGTFTVGGLPRAFLAMELVEGLDVVQHALAERLDLPRRVELLARVAEAVDHAHARGIVHRDLEPAKVLVDREAVPKVLDFGVARVSSSLEGVSSLWTSTGELVGTQGYMAPEQVRGEGDQVTPATDVYSLGVLLHELLVGRPPVDTRGMGPAAAVRAVLQARPPRLRGQGIARDLETIVRKSLEAEPARRYATAGELAADLRRFLAHRPIAARPASRLVLLWKLVRRHRGASLGLSLAMLALGTAAAL